MSNTADLHALLGSAAGLGAPPPLVGMDNMEKGGTVGAPPELLPPGEGMMGGMGTPALLNRGPPTPSATPSPAPVGNGGAGGSAQHDKLKYIRQQKEALQKELDLLNNAEEELVDGDVDRRPGTPTIQARVATSSPPPLVPTPTPPTHSMPMPQHGQVLSLDQAMRMASVGWNLASSPAPPSVATSQPVSVEVLLKHLQTMRLTEFVRDQSAMQWLQKVSDEGTEPHIGTVVDILLAEPADVFTDPVTSPLIPGLFYRASEHQKKLLVEKLGMQMQHISMNMHGTRVVQKIIEQVASKEQVDMLMVVLTQNIPQLIKDLNGNHIVQQVLQSFPSEVNQPIHDTLLQRVVEFGTHRHGCCVLQRCIEFGSDSQKMQLVYEVINNGLCLVQDPFGNYLLQYILEMDLDFINVKVIRQFLGNIPGLSMNKFASNVIEKCLKISPEDVRQLIIDELCDRTKLPLLLQDQYANYVIQTALGCCNQSQFYSLQMAIRPLMHLIKNTPHGKRIESRLRTRTFDHVSAVATPPRKTFPRGGDALGVTPDGQWLRGDRGTPSSHADIPVETTPLNMTPPAAFLPIQTSPLLQNMSLPSPCPSDGNLNNSIGEMKVSTPSKQAISPARTPSRSESTSGAFRLNANARPFVSPPSASAANDRADDSASNGLGASGHSSGNNSPAQKMMHPALVFGGDLDD